MNALVGYCLQVSEFVHNEGPKHALSKDPEIVTEYSLFIAKMVGYFFLASLVLRIVFEVVAMVTPSLVGEYVNFSSRVRASYLAKVTSSLHAVISVILAIDAINHW
jgi:hypothetical protein